MIHVCSIGELKKKEITVVKGEKNPIAVFYHNDKVKAVDNRCPHLGFPLSKGTVKDGILTCHWHQAKFDLCSGCAFDVWADDIPSYETKVEDGQVYVSPLNKLNGKRNHLEGLLKGMKNNISLVQAKNLLEVLHEKKGLKEIIAQVAKYGSQNQNDSGIFITLGIIANISKYLSKETLYYSLLNSINEIAQACANSSSRRKLDSLGQTDHTLDELSELFQFWIQNRHRDGAERTLLTIIENKVPLSHLNTTLVSAISEKIYANQGHDLDFTNKLFELIHYIGTDHSYDILPLILNTLTKSRGAEENSNWKHPVNIVDKLEEINQNLDQLFSIKENLEWSEHSNLIKILQEDNPLATIDYIKKSILDGAPIHIITKCISYAAALRLARFSSSNEIRDWFNVQHTFNYCNAVHQSLKRSRSPEILISIFHAAISVYMDRFLNIPPKKLPRELNQYDSLPDTKTELLEQILNSFDQKADQELAAKLTSRYIQSKFPVNELIDKLTYATVREDLDFHPLQNLEAGVQQYFEWEGQPEAEDIIVGVVRQLAAFCPTNRNTIRNGKTALKLSDHKKLYEDDA